MAVRCRKGPVRPLLGLVIAVLVLLVNTAEASTVRVDNGRALVEAIADATVDRVVVSQPIALQPSDFPEHVIKLNRSLTLTSDPAGPHMVRMSVQRALNFSVINTGRQRTCVQL